MTTKRSPSVARNTFRSLVTGPTISGLTRRCRSQTKRFLIVIDEKKVFLHLKSLVSRLDPDKRFVGFIRAVSCDLVDRTEAKKMIH
jgi:hypothetical protein